MPYQVKKVRTSDLFYLVDTWRGLNVRPANEVSAGRTFVQVLAAQEPVPSNKNRASGAHRVGHKLYMTQNNRCKGLDLSILTFVRWSERSPERSSSFWRVNGGASKAISYRVYQTICIMNKIMASIY